MATTNKIFIQIDDERIELTGEAKEALLAEQKAEADSKALLEAEYKAKQDSRESAIKKLAEIAGLTKDELNAIL
jgi:hypothetical protein